MDLSCSPPLLHMLSPLLKICSTPAIWFLVLMVKACLKKKKISQQMQEKFNPRSVDLWVLLSFVLPPPTPISLLILEKAPSTLRTLHWAR